MKKKCIIIIAVVCVAVVAVAGTVFGVRAYNDYTLQQQTEERIKSIDDTHADFLDETEDLRIVATCYCNLRIK